MATACRIGGMVSDVSADTLDALTQFGQHVGMCFQIVDDVLDVTAQRRRARQAGRQRRARRRVHAAGDLRARAVARAARPARPQARMAARSNGSSRSSPCPTSIDASLAVARTHAAKANEALAGAPELDADVCDRLRTLVDGLVLRSS